MSYEEADIIATNVGKGLRVLGQEPNKPLCIFADTRSEWMLSAQVSSDQSEDRIIMNQPITGLLQTILPRGDSLHQPGRGRHCARHQRG